MNLLYYIFGRCCPICGNTVDPRCSSGICDSCAEEIASRRLIIPSCENRHTVAEYYFEEPLRRGLHRFKYNGEIAFGKICGKALAERYRQRDDRADAVTCVPRAKDERPRLYNQSAVIAKTVAKELKLPFDPNLLSKRKGMLTQPECPTHLAREQNAKRAYRKGKSKRDLTGQRVLLVDDLYTTGATAGACCTVLKKQGAADALIYTALRIRTSDDKPMKINFDRVNIHQDFPDPICYGTRQFRRPPHNNSIFLTVHRFCL